MGCSNAEGIWVIRELQKGRIACIYEWLLTTYPSVLFDLWSSWCHWCLVSLIHPCRDDRVGCRLHALKYARDDSLHRKTHFLRCGRLCPLICWGLRQLRLVWQDNSIINRLVRKFEGALIIIYPLFCLVEHFPNIRPLFLQSLFESRFRGAQQDSVIMIFALLFGPTIVSWCFISRPSLVWLET